MSNSMQLFGDKKLQKLLLTLPKRLQRKALRRGVTKGARLVARTAKQKTPRETGTLKKSIGIRTYTSRGKESVGAVAGPRRGFKSPIRKKHGWASKKNGKAQYRDPTRYAHLVEFGTKHSAARPFLRPAFDALWHQVVTMVGSEVKVEIKKARA